MKTARQIPGWLRSRRVACLLFVLTSPGGLSVAAADGIDAEIGGRSPGSPAVSNAEQAKWAYTKSFRLELALSEHLRVETKIPLDRAEEPQLILSVAKPLSRSWSMELTFWTSL